MAKKPKSAATQEASAMGKNKTTKKEVKLVTNNKQKSVEERPKLDGDVIYIESDDENDNYIIKKKVQTPSKGKKSKKELEVESPDSDESNEPFDSEEEKDEEDGDDVSGDEYDHEEGEEDDDEDDDEDDEDFEDQGSSDEEELLELQAADSSSDEQVSESETEGDDKKNDTTVKNVKKESKLVNNEEESLQVSRLMHTDNLSSDEEEVGNTIGRIPLHWYDEYDHIGYNVQGQKVMKRVKGDGIDEKIAARDDPNFFRTIYDALNDKEIILSEREIEIVRRIQAGAFPHAEFDATPDYIDYYTHEKMEMPITGQYFEPKRHFMQSRWEQKKVEQLIEGLRSGRYKFNRKQNKEGKKKKEFYLLWEDGEKVVKKKHTPKPLPAPKMPLPGHRESYNPPAEYLPSKKTQKAIAKKSPEERPMFVPQKFSCLRHVGAYEHLVQERFERCLDLYLAPRFLKQKLNIDPESLIPQLPKPKDLKPFPTTRAIHFRGHTDKVRCVVISNDAQFIASGSDDQTIRIWESDTGRCVHTFKVGDKVKQIVWNPNPAHHVLAAAVGNSVLLITTGTGDVDSTVITDALLYEAENSKDKKNSSLARWEVVSAKSQEFESLAHLNTKPDFCSHARVRVALRFNVEVNWVSWHHKGDYFVTVTPDSNSRSVLVHQLSKKQSQAPFRKNKGVVQAAVFHPTKPFLLVATQQHVRVYHLTKQMLAKKLLSGCKWISTIDIHPSGDHVIIGSLDRRVVWFDLDLASTPFRTLKYHTKALRCVQFHPHYPLMATSSDDGRVHIFHATVYSDFMRNPLIVPVKILPGYKNCPIYSIVFHPLQPWIYTASGNGSLTLYQDL